MCLLNIRSALFVAKKCMRNNWSRKYEGRSKSNKTRVTAPFRKSVDER